MLLCPKCQGQHLSVVDSRNRKDNEYVYRRRKCKDCGYRFPTVEIVDEQYADFQKLQQTQNQVFQWEKDQEGNEICGRCKKPHLRTINGAHLLSPFCPECGADLRESKKLGSFSPLEYRLR